jgi:DNA ligase-1
LEQAYVAARAPGNEGVMLKARHSTYQPGRRGLTWLQLKRELATLDVVVTAAEYGHGRRAGWLSKRCTGLNFTGCDKTPVLYQGTTLVGP